MRIGKWILVGLMAMAPSAWSSLGQAQVTKLPIRNPPAKQLDHKQMFPPKEKNSGVNRLSPSENGSPGVSNEIGQGSTKGESRDERRAATSPSDAPGSSEQGRVAESSPPVETRSEDTRRKSAEELKAKNDARLREQAGRK